jgi:predicted membrane channel-forming protein YqfA (hemolysin III family)
MEYFFHSIEPEYISKNVIYEDEDERKNAAKDGRMFNNCKLYCEGAHKPVFRGYFHALALLLFPYIVWKYWDLTNKTGGFAFYLAMFLFFSGFATILTSALYHTVNWNVEQEILINKMDHAILMIFVMSIFYPVLLLAFSEEVKWIGYLFLAIITGLTGWNLYGTFYGRPSLFRMMSVPFSQVPILYYYYKFMTDFEWKAFWVCAISQIVGVIIFVKEFTVFDPNIIGFHEIYHVTTIISMVAAYMMNYSIIERFQMSKSNIEKE